MKNHTRKEPGHTPSTSHKTLEGGGDRDGRCHTEEYPVSATESLQGSGPQRRASQPPGRRPGKPRMGDFQVGCQVCTAWENRRWGGEGTGRWPVSASQTGQDGPRIPRGAADRTREGVACEGRENSLGLWWVCENLKYQIER